MNEEIQQGLELLQDWQAPPLLIRHSQLVAQVALEIIIGLEKLFDISLSRSQILSGAVLHDAGKILHPEELTSSGSEHEKVGEVFLLERQIPPEVAQFARTHGNWSDPKCQIEDWIVALADTLWKGKRKDDLEGRILLWMSEVEGLDFWLVFPAGDSLFEEIASRGLERLAFQRSGE